MLALVAWNCLDAKGFLNAEVVIGVARYRKAVWKGLKSLDVVDDILFFSSRGADLMREMGRGGPD